MFRCIRMTLCFALLSTAAGAACSQAMPDLSGSWKQDNGRCLPKRNGDVTLRIEQHEPKLRVETSIQRNSASPRHAIQNYTTDGKISVSTGADGDEFHTAIVKTGATLVFSIEEHEDGRVLLSTEIWSIIEDGATLKRIRERAKGEGQTLFYRRVMSGLDGKATNPQERDK